MHVRVCAFGVEEQRVLSLELIGKWKTLENPRFWYWENGLPRGHTIHFHVSFRECGSGNSE